MGVVPDHEIILLTLPRIFERQGGKGKGVAAKLYA